MLRAFLYLVFAILLADASGLAAFVSPEPCTSLTESVPDSQCPALCMRCGCCAQPTVPAVAPPAATAELVSTVPVSYVRTLTVGAPHDILHVPR